MIMFPRNLLTSCHSACFITEHKVVLFSLWVHVVSLSVIEIRTLTVEWKAADNWGFKSQQSPPPPPETDQSWLFLFPYSISKVTLALRRQGLQIWSPRTLALSIKVPCEVLTYRISVSGTLFRTYKHPGDAVHLPAGGSTLFPWCTGGGNMPTKPEKKNKTTADWWTCMEMILD